MLKVESVSVRRGGTTTLDDVSLSLGQGRTLAVVGESGAGKSTLISAILGLVRTSQGNITWNGGPVAACLPALVMQEPRSAFNPALTLRRSVLEPVQGQHGPDIEARVQRLCTGLELPVSILARKPFEVSIGQAQRVGILRALISAPQLVLFDEPLSALDAATQKHTARLIADVQREEGFAALIVTHDLGYAVAHADQIAVLRAGRVEELGDAQTVAQTPKSDYSRVLLQAAIALGSLEAQV